MAKDWPTIWGAAVAVAALLGTATVAAQPGTPADKAAADKAAADKAAADKAAADKAPADKAGTNTDALLAAAKIHDEAAKAAGRAGDFATANDKLALAKSVIDSVKAPADQAKVDAAKASHADAQASVNKDASSICGAGQARPQFCFYVGVFVASGSLTGFSIGGLHGGKTGHALVSTAIPALGVRMPLDKQARFSIEIGLMSMLISKDVTASTQRSGCRVANGDFEKRLPCEGNVSVSPVIGSYFGLTAGTSDIGLITLMPMVGGATTSLDGSIRPYYGLAIGLVNLSKTFNLNSKTE